MYDTWLKTFFFFFPRVQLDDRRDPCRGNNALYHAMRNSTDEISTTSFFLPPICCRHRCLFWQHPEGPSRMCGAAETRGHRHLHALVLFEMEIVRREEEAAAAAGGGISRPIISPSSRPIIVTRPRAALCSWLFGEPPRLARLYNATCTPHVPMSPVGRAIAKTASWGSTLSIYIPAFAVTMLPLPSSRFVVRYWPRM